MKTTRKIYMDFDGVILDSVAIICLILSKRDNVFYNPARVKKWNMMDVIPYATNELITDIFDSKEFWDYAEYFIMAGAKEFIRANKDDIIICSIGGIKNQLNKIAFTEKHFGNIDMLPIITDMRVHPKSINKTYIKMGEGDIFIEDSASNLLDSHTEYQVLFNNYNNFDSEWSANPDDEEFDYYCTNFNQITKVVEEYKLITKNRRN